MLDLVLQERVGMTVSSDSSSCSEPNTVDDEFEEGGESSCSSERSEDKNSQSSSDESCPEDGKHVT